MKKPTIKKLYRSHDQKILTGVCGGLAEYFSVDVTLIRLAFVILTIIGGSGLLIYIIMSIIIPIEKHPHPVHQANTKLKRKKLFGFIAIGLDIIILSDILLPQTWRLISNELIFPFLLITFGCLLILKQSE